MNISTGREVDRMTGDPDAGEPLHLWTHPGIIVVDKPRGPSSHQVAAWVGKMLGCQVGHAGTLDPQVSGVLLIMLEEKRREAHCIAKHDEKHSGNLRVKCSCMPYLATEHLPYPRGYLMARRASWLINHHNPGMIPQMEGFSRIRISGHSIHFPVW
jgi:hypothetical protein